VLGGAATEVRLTDGAVTARLGGTERQQGAADALLRTAAFALGWRPEPAPAAPVGLAGDRPLLRFHPSTP
jgi:hypothetical protein